MAEKGVSEVPLSFLEYRTIFREPIFEAWEPLRLLPAVFRAFREWRIGLENISWKTEPTNGSEIEIRFTLLNARVIFTVGLGAATTFVWNPTWEEVELIGRIVKAGTDAVRGSAKPDVDRHVVSLSMHVKPNGRSVREITSQFVRVPVTKMPDTKAHAFGFSVYREEGFWVVDASGSFPDALFLKVVRISPPESTVEEIASGLKQDESELLELLDLRIH